MDTWMILLGAAAAIVLGFLLLGLAARRQAERAESRFPPRGRFVTVAGARLHCVERGEGPAVILLHGEGGSAYDFFLSPLFGMLAASYRVAAFDRPGSGYSRRPVGAGSPEDQARLVHAAAGELGIGRAVVLGHGPGGAVALAYGLAFPDDTAAVVALAGAPGWDPPGASWLMRPLLLPLAGPALAGTLYPLLGSVPAHLALQSAFSPERPPPPEFAAAHAALKLRPACLLAAASDLAGAAAANRALLARLRDFPVPLVIVHGTADQAAPFQDSERLHAVVPRSILVPVRGAGHALAFTRPKAAAEAVERAWDEARLADFEFRIAQLAWE